jgi:riboflavin biosynthesis pyrimidine reductase
MVSAGLADDLRLYMAPMAFGGQGAPAWLGGDGVARIARAPRFRFHGEPERLGDDLAVTLRPVKTGQKGRNRGKR